MAGILDRLQRTMLGYTLTLKKEATEDAESYNRRRGREASRLLQGALWSIAFAQRVVSWHGHITRQRNQGSWAAQLLAWRGEQWLQDRRRQEGSQGLLAGLLNLRARRGQPRTRWEAGVAAAKLRLQASAR